MSETTKFSNWGGFGNLVFKGRLTPKSLQSTKQWRVNASQVANGYPFHHLQGEDEHSLSVEMQLHNEFCDLATCTRQLEELAGNQVPRGLVVGNKSYGQCLIKRVTQTGMKTKQNGTLISVTYQCDLVEVRE
ncbi:phage tail protein [Vibrio mimicus]